VRDWTGEPTPPHAVSAGLAILAFSLRSTQNSFLSKDLEALTERTMTNPNALRDRFETVRAQGYVWAVQEFTDDINSVAAPITDQSGRVTLALHVHGPAFRFPGDLDKSELGDRVAATAQRIESQLHAR